MLREPSFTESILIPTSCSDSNASLFYNHWLTIAVVKKRERLSSVIVPSLTANGYSWHSYVIKAVCSVAIALLLWLNFVGLI